MWACKYLPPVDAPPPSNQPKCNVGWKMQRGGLLEWEVVEGPLPWCFTSQSSRWCRPQREKNPVEKAPNTKQIYVDRSARENEINNGSSWQLLLLTRRLDRVMEAPGAQLTSTLKTLLNFSCPLSLMLTMHSFLQQSWSYNHMEK